MDAEKYQKIKQIFNRAAEMPLLERQNFVSSECGDDSEMRREIEKMLVFADDNTTTDALEKNAFEIFTNGNHAKIPAQIGNYKIIGELGRGGMGAVYEAVRESRDFTQKAALKVIKRGMDTDAILSRFRHEQKILSSLEHPNIARFLDGGMTEDGLPFYAMEFVEGEFIDDYCRERNLSINERLQLFRQVCSAVQYAHQNLVIHRDLKSKNILVTRDGTPKLLDFGISKVLTPDETQEIGTATQFGMMTPAYASPEQILGKRIGTASDIYSLGVILFELLTGQKPYKFNSNSQIEIERAVCESEPVRPSSALMRSAERGMRNVKPERQKEIPQSAIRNPHLLKGDLDNIILKALRKEPSERYASVGQFSEDIRRYLEGLPILARPHTFSYRAAKFVKRNRLAVSAAALIFLSLCVGITVAIWQARRAEQQRILAENRFRQVRQLANSVVFKYHDAIAELQGSTAAREMLVRDALQYLDALATESADDTELQKELALAYLKLGDAQGKVYAANVGNTEGALASYRKSIALFESVKKSAPDDTDAKENLIKAYDSLAFLLTRSGGGNEARELIEKALDLYAELEKLEPENIERKMQKVELLIRYGDTASGFENNLREHLKVLPVVEELVQSDAENVEKLRQFARAHQRVGTDYERLGDKAAKENRADEAREFYRQSLEYQRKMFDAARKVYQIEPEKPANRRYLALAFINLADALGKNGNMQEAIEMLEKARSIIEENLRADAKNSETKFDLSVVFESFGIIYAGAGDVAKALENYQKSLALDEEIYRADAKNIESLGRIVTAYETLAELSAKTGDNAKAEFYREQARKFSNKKEEFFKK